VRDFNVSKIIIIIKIEKIEKKIKCYVNIFRTSASGGTGRAVGGGPGMEKDITTYSARGSGTDLVIIKNFLIELILIFKF
jgi:hypothetical protein